MRDEIMRLADMAKSLWESTGNDEACYLERELRALARTAHAEDKLGMVPEWSDAQVGAAMLAHHRSLKAGKLPSEAWRDALAAASPAPDHSAGVGEMVSGDVRTAFVKGAKWWEFKSTGGTMWQSDQKLAWEAACKKYPEAALAQPADADSEGGK